MMVLSAVFALGAAEGGAGLSAGLAAVLGAGIAALASLLTAWLTSINQRKLATQADQASKTHRHVERLSAQLSYLYGPLRLLTEQSKALAEKLREGKPDSENWHFLDNLVEVARNPTDRAIADQILAVNGEVERRIFTHAGFLKDGEIPDSFIQFLGHYRFLRIAFEEAKQIEPSSSEAVPRGITARDFQYYPTAFDTDVASAYDSIQHEREHTLRG